MVDRHHPFATRLSLVTGKGGTGKSTIVAALAIEAQRRGMAPLIVELGHRASMQAIFGVAHVGHEPSQVAPGVYATNLDLDRALADYVRAHVPVRALARRIAKSASLRRFFHAAPGVPEVLTLWHLEELLAELEGGVGRWDPVIVDFDATGHALMFLELPRVFEGLVAKGPIRRLLDSFAAILSDRARTRLHVVTLPGRLPVRETIELCARIAAEHAIGLGRLFVNRVPSAPPVSEPILHALLSTPISEPARTDLLLVERALSRQRAIERELATLDELTMPRVTLPFLRGAIDMRALELLGRTAGGA